MHVVFVACTIVGHGKEAQPDANILCEKCSKCRPKEYFSEASRRIWVSMVVDTGAVICLPCSGVKMKTGQEEVEKIRCNACLTLQPLYNFIERQLTGWREEGTVEQEAECARCIFRRRPYQHL